MIRLWAGTIFAFIVLAALAALRTADWSYGADTGTFVQIVLDAFGGMHNGVEQTTHYRFHWSPSLVLLWPALAATHGVWVLQAILTLATVACAPLLAAIARAHGIEPSLAERIGAVALVYPPLVAVGFAEFRDLGLLPPLALGWWLALQRRHWIWVALCAIVLAGLREDVCLELAIVGLAVALVAAWRGDRSVAIAGAASAVVALASLATYALVVLPRVGPWPPSHFYVYPFADGPRELLLAPFTHPLAFAAAIFTLGRLTYLAEALVPLALIPLRTRLFWLPIPGFAIVLLANSGLVWRMGMHYAALWIPWLLIAFAAGIATLRIPRRWTTIAFVLSAIALVAFSPLHPLHYLKPSYHALDDARAVLATIPPQATLGTHDEWYTALSPRYPHAFVLGTGPNPYAGDYLVFAEDYPNTDFRQRILPQIRAILQRERYRLVVRRGAVVAYRRGRSPGDMISRSPRGNDTEHDYPQREADRLARHRFTGLELRSQAAGTW